MVQPLINLSQSWYAVYMNTKKISVVVRDLKMEAQDVLCLELASLTGDELPKFVPGMYVDVHLPNGLVRSYSLIEHAAGGGSYRIAVKREAQGRGGSTAIHDVITLGMQLSISTPKGEFTLIEQPAMSCFIAGGIGITPLFAMIERQVELGYSWQLHFAAASLERMVFRQQLQDMAAKSGGQVFFYFSDGSTPRMNITAIARSLNADPSAHLYCCGPTRMVNDFLASTQSRDSSSVHFERFGADLPLATEGGYTVELASTGRCYQVPAGKTILDVLLEAGLDLPYSCGQGVCGSCHTQVISGEVDHRDCYLTEDERATNSAMLICCSGAKSSHLMLDI